MNLSPVDPGASFVSPCEIWVTPYPSLCGSAPLTAPSLPSISHPAERVGDMRKMRRWKVRERRGPYPCWNLEEAQESLGLVCNIRAVELV